MTGAPDDKPATPDQAMLAHLQASLPAPAEDPLAASEEDDAWLLTYLDTFTLLLTAFVLLIATHGLGKPAIEAVRQALQQAAVPSGGEPAVSAALDMEHRLIATVRVAGLGDFVAVRREPGMLVIDVRDAVLFASGEATLRDDGAGLIGRLAAVLAKDTGAVEVIGHTDRRPIATARFPSNWELSSARASAVVRGLIDAGLIPARLSAVGRADTEPLAVERTDAGRARNRRVEIRLRIPQ